MVRIKKLYAVCDQIQYIYSIIAERISAKLYAVCDQTGFYLEKKIGGKLGLSPRAWVREGDVPPPARSAEAEPFLITNKLNI